MSIDLEAIVEAAAKTRFESIIVGYKWDPPGTSWGRVTETEREQWRAIVRPEVSLIAPLVEEAVRAQMAEAVAVAARRERERALDEAAQKIEGKATVKRRLLARWTSLGEGQIALLRLEVDALSSAAQAVREMLP
jgi:hypothetical protein